MVRGRKLQIGTLFFFFPLHFLPSLWLLGKKREKEEEEKKKKILGSQMQSAAAAAA